MQRFIVVMASAIGLAASFGMQPAQAVQVCSDPSGCAQISVGSGSGTPGSTVTVGLSFSQGPDDGHDGGIDEVAALALTLSLGGAGAGAPVLTLADCGADPNGLPLAIKPNAAITNFNFVVQNARCVNGHTHCLCPEAGSGITPDYFINVAIFGPNLQTASAPITIPLLPNGQLFTVDLTIAPGASGTIPLHIINSAADTQHPQSMAFLSIGDRLQTDQTCTPVTGQRPCGAPDATSQVAALDGNIVVTSLSTATPTHTLPPTLTPTHTPPPTLTPSVTPSDSPTATVTSHPTATLTAEPTATSSPTVTSSPTPSVTQSHTPSPTATASATLTATATSQPTATATPPCVGDCNQDRTVTVDEILTMVNIALGGDSVTKCVAGDLNGDQQITIDEILTAVFNAMNGCGNT